MFKELAEMNKRWVPLEEINLLNPDAAEITVDTRDFCIVQHPDREHTIKGLHKIKKFPERFFFTQEEIMEFLRMSYKQSGGKKNWRLLMYIDKDGNLLGGDWQFKYLRFYQVGDNAYVLKPGDRCIRKDQVVEATTHLKAYYE